jgi:hypothetical protein
MDSTSCIFGGPFLNHKVWVLIFLSEVIQPLSFLGVYLLIMKCGASFFVGGHLTPRIFRGVFLSHET